MNIPDELIQNLTIYCESNGIGILRIVDKKNGIEIILTVQDSAGISPSVASLMASRILLNGALDGLIDSANQFKVQEDDSSTKH